MMGTIRAVPFHMVQAHSKSLTPLFQRYVQDVEDCSESDLESGFGNPPSVYEVELSAIGESDKAPSKFVSSGFFGFEASDNNCKKDTKFELELLELQLPRASHEMVGKGTLGTVYRLLLDDGRVLAAKVLEDSNPSNRGPGREPLDWTAMLRLLLGAARGLSWIHQEYSGIPHGSIISCNILIGQNHEACISDFGMPLFSLAYDVIAHLGGYMAPEQADSNTLSQEVDVYSFGVLILEVLTGRVPTQCLPLLPDSTSKKKHTKSVGVASLDE
ncbi:Leucine-rich repeat receptor-like protein kinase PXC1 [Carex littledalei]|uniref:Leucine-rich repeat receptor-like protein kinase PXC1 n=1 Tax=Carex littledalei TaxID=544730 RepID=A0A833R2Z8_9POAL|nr:Leucine-rich repeat receptor-like protein kinase PXC1 [Carex littledalei]